MRMLRSVLTPHELFNVAVQDGMARAIMRTHLLTGAAVIGLLISLPTSGATPALSFTKIADTSGAIQSLGGVSINDHGTVAFVILEATLSHRAWR